MKGTKGKLAAAGVLILIVVGYFVVTNMLKGPAPVITFENTEVVIGTTKLQELFDQGYKPSEESLKSKSWDNYALYMDGALHGKVRIKNSSPNYKAKADCVIFGFEINYALVDTAVYVDGTNYENCTMDDIKEILAEFEFTLEREDEAKLYFTKGDYTYRFTFEDGVISRLLIVDSTDAVYTDGDITFGSY